MVLFKMQIKVTNSNQSKKKKNPPERGEFTNSKEKYKGDKCNSIIITSSTLFPVSIKDDWMLKICT